MTSRAAEAPLLMTPGPTRVPERVLAAGARPMIHHRSPEFSRELATAIELLAPVFGTRSTPMPVHTTGRGALEATICNLFSAGDEIAVCCNGKFGEMWAGFAETYGLVVHRFTTDWERDADANELERLLAEHSQVRAVALAYVDTSTGVANDVTSIARVARQHGALVPGSIVGRGERARLASGGDSAATTTLLGLHGDSPHDLGPEAGDPWNDAGAHRPPDSRSAPHDS